MELIRTFKQLFFISIFVPASFIVAFFHSLSLPLLLFKLNHLQRRWVGFFTRLHWGIVVGYAQWIGDYKLNLIADEDTLKDFNKVNSLWLLNHRYQIEWIGLQIIGKYFGFLENMKGVGKHSLLCLPIVGWTLFFNEFVLVKRNFQKDKKIIEKSLETLSTIQDPFAFIIFCEGTRFTTEKHETSMEFAEKHNFQKLRHHLLPRTKGFHILKNGMKSFVPWVYCATICFQGDNDPTLLDFINLKPIKGEMLIRRIPISEVPDDEEACGEFVRRLYIEKDEFIDFYKKNGKFPLETQKEFKDFRSVPMKRDLGTAFILFGWIFFFSICLWIIYLQISNLAPILYTLVFLIFTGVIGFLGMLMVVNKYSSYGKKP